MKRVLVTGATGFTGRYVVPVLRERGYDVKGLSSRDCDIRDAAALRRAVELASPHFVIHLAGTPNLPDTEADRLISVNVQGTVNLLEACARLAQPPEKVLLASSCYVYGETGAIPATEETPLAPTGTYGRSKAAMEDAARRYFDRLPILIVRPFNYSGVGHGERFLLPKLVKVFRERGGDVSFVAPNVVRDFSDVRWLASVYADLLRCAEKVDAVNACSGIGTPLRTLVSLLEEMTGHRPLRRVGPAEGHPSSLVGDPSRLVAVLGPTSPFPLRQMLRWMLNETADREA